MKPAKTPTAQSFTWSMRSFFLMCTLSISGLAWAETPAAPAPADSGAATPLTPIPGGAPRGVPPLPDGSCPLNTGGPSLLGTSWKPVSIYGNAVPPQLDIKMTVQQNAMVGFGGCNNYTANFTREGNRGIRVLKMHQTRKGCAVIRPAPGAPTINVGNWEGNFLRVLGRASSAEQLPTTLQLYDQNGKASMVLRRSYGSGEEQAPTPAQPEAPEQQQQTMIEAAPEKPIS